MIFKDNHKNPPYGCLFGIAMVLLNRTIETPLPDLYVRCGRGLSMKKLLRRKKRVMFFLSSHNFHGELMS